MIKTEVIKTEGRGVCISLIGTGPPSNNLISLKLLETFLNILFQFIIWVSHSIVLNFLSDIIEENITESEQNKRHKIENW